ncbi:MAG: hypothetical protein NT124_03735 [Candidatus Dependentiae bacterium]|nr:hypothetical protein [Candidatus Dependentiae bacterium]
MKMLKTNKLMLTGLLMVSVAPMFAAEESGFVAMCSESVVNGIDRVGLNLPNKGLGLADKYQGYVGRQLDASGELQAVHGVKAEDLHAKKARSVLAAAIAGTAYYTVKGAVKLVKGAYNWMTKEEEVVQEEVVETQPVVEPAPVVEKVAPVVTQTRKLTPAELKRAAGQARKAARQAARRNRR